MSLAQSLCVSNRRQRIFLFGLQLATHHCAVRLLWCVIFAQLKETDMSDADHDDILRKHREKFEAHKRWMEEQRESLAMLTPSLQPTAGQPANVVSSDQRSPQAEDAVASASYARATGSPLNVHARSNQWARRREQKLEEMRQEHSIESVGQCTFKPEISSARRRPIPVDPSAVSGWDNFLKRQDIARRLEQEKRSRLTFDGSGWRNRTTVPDEFRLGQAPVIRSNIKSLELPMKPPVRMDWSAPPRPAASLFEEAEHTAALPPKGIFSSKLTSAVLDSSAGRPL